MAPDIIDRLKASAYM